MVDPAVMADQMAHQDSDAASTMLVPIVTLIITMPVALYVTGDGDISAGSGSTSVLWAVLLALTTVWVLGLVRRQTRIEELMQLFFKGAGGLLPVAMILLFSLALGDIANALGTGIYVAQLAQSAVPMAALLPLLFVLSAFIAFSIGSSWGTFAIMIPLAMQIVLALDVNASIFLAAVLSGAVFGDHASPISDTTVVASMAAATDHIDHVRTQLPYALLSAGIATLAFFAVGVLTL
jgi:Na+/H+ antiporter NhaC